MKRRFCDTRLGQVHAVAAGAVDVFAATEAPGAWARAVLEYVAGLA